MSSIYMSTEIHMLLWWKVNKEVSIVEKDGDGGGPSECN